MSSGLSTAEAVSALSQHGYNELPSAKPKNLWRIAIEVMQEPMFGLLIACGILYMVLGDYREGAILLSTIFVVIIITFFQHRKTEKALDALRKLSSPRALVIRDGSETRIPGREVVPGDLLILNEGDRVAADAVVLNTTNLTIDESLLTGESMPVSKNPDTDGVKVYSGTLVVQGKGLAKVVATGISTEFGKIGSSLGTIEEEQTRLQKEMKRLIRSLFVIGAIICIGVVLAFYFTRGNLLQSLLSGLAAAMAILPEEFPVILTIFLALGSWRLAKQNVLTRKASAIETLGSATVLCSDKTGTITQNKMEVAALYNGRELVEKQDFFVKRTELEELVDVMRLASSNDPMDPMEKAICQTHAAYFPGSGNTELVREYPLSHELLAMTRVTLDHKVSAKGAPEAIFSLCRLNDAEKSRYLAVVNDMAANGYRVIGVAAARQEGDLPEKQSDFCFRFLGLVALEDPIRPEVPEAVRECKAAGIKIIMITGDFPATAKCIARQIGFDKDSGVMTGQELSALSDNELRIRIRDIDIFARVLPEHKLRIVHALKANNEVVAMTGDGVNDAPALKAADIGVAMGNKGTDVAREASSLVLLNDNFASIVAAIRAGRRIYDNLQKAMSYVLAIHIPIIGLALFPAFFTWLPVLLMPLHIVFMELIIDPVCSIAFESEQEEKRIMKRPPRNPDKRFFSRSRIILSILKGLLLLGMVIGVYFLSIREGHTDGEVRAIAFSSLIVGNIFLILANLSKTRSFVSIIVEKNIAVMTILGVAILLLLLILTVPMLQQIFNLEFPGFRHFIPALIGAGAVLAIVEAFKLARNVRRKRGKIV